MKIFCIIVTYNSLTWIDRCLKSLQQSSKPVIPIVVDNCSTDNTISYIRNYYPETIILPQSQNLGFGQANNLGMEYAMKHSATHILLLNQDAAIQENTLSKLLACDDGNHILSPIHLNGNGSHIDYLFYKGSIIDNALDNDIVEDLLIRNIKSFYDIKFANAACWMIPASFIVNIGGFNPLFFHYGEDNNYIQRIHYHKYGLRLVPNAFIYHDREKHGNELMYIKGELFRSFLSVETNICLSNKERFIMRHKIAIQKFGLAIISHRVLYFIKDWIIAKTKICFMWRQIQLSRQRERCIAPNWINI